MSAGLWRCKYVYVIPHIFSTSFTIGIYLSRTGRCGNYRKFRRVVGQVMKCHMCGPSIARLDLYLFFLCQKMKISSSNQSRTFIKHLGVLLPSNDLNCFHFFRSISDAIQNEGTRLPNRLRKEIIYLSRKSFPSLPSPPYLLSQDLSKIR